MAVRRAKRPGGLTVSLSLVDSWHPHFGVEGPASSVSPPTDGGSRADFAVDSHIGGGWRVTQAIDDFRLAIGDSFGIGDRIGVRRRGSGTHAHGATVGA